MDKKSASMEELKNRLHKAIKSYAGAMTADDMPAIIRAENLIDRLENQIRELEAVLQEEMESE